LAVREVIVRRSWRALALAATVVAGCQPTVPLSTPVASVPSPSTPASSSTAGPSQTPISGNPSIAWTLIQPQGDLADCRNTAAALVRRDGSLLVICQDSSLRSIALTSVDGSTWSATATTGLVPRQQPNPGLPDVVLLNGLAEGPGGLLVAVGAEPLEDISAGDAAAWTSTDGVAWHRANVGGFHDAAMLAAVSARGAFVAVGSDGFPGGNTQLPGLRGPAAWTSTDGMTWARHAVEAAQRRAQPVQMTGVTSTDGRLVAWGSAAPPDTGVVWTSADGETWARASAPAGGAWGPDRIIAPGSRLVGVGSWGIVDAAGEKVSLPGTWESTDGGRHWRDRPVTGGPEVGGSDRLIDVAPLGTRLFAVGRTGNVYASDDGGQSWVFHSSGLEVPGGSIDRVLSTGYRLVVFGSIESADGLTTVLGIWIGDPV
jgi:hypothetical protein